MSDPLTLRLALAFLASAALASAALLLTGCPPERDPLEARLEHEIRLLRLEVERQELKAELGKTVRR